MTTYTWGGKSITLEVDKWYNLKTRRQIKNPQSDTWFLRELKIAGSKELIEQFALDNKLNYGNIMKGATFESIPSIEILILNDDKGPKPPNYPPPSDNFAKVIKAEYYAENPLTVNIGLGVSYETKVTPIKEVSCVVKPTAIGSFIYYPTSSDIKDIPLQQLNRLCDFTLNGYKTAVRTIEVHDGDTVRFAFIIKLQELAKPVTRLEKGAIEQDFRLFCCQNDVGMTVVMKCRLYGIDTAESNTAQGALATALLRALSEKNNDIFYANFLEFDKYGRPLVDLYFDVARKESVIEYLLRYRDPNLGVVAVKYNGDTKSDYMKNLPIIKASDAVILQKQYFDILHKYFFPSK